MPDPVLSARSRFNAMRRHHGDVAPETINAARDLAAEKIAAAVQRIVAEAPPLSDEQRQRIVTLLCSPAGTQDVRAAG